MVGHWSTVVVFVSYGDIRQSLLDPLCLGVQFVELTVFLICFLLDLSLHGQGCVACLTW